MQIFVRGKKGLKWLISGVISHIPDPLSTGISASTLHLVDMSKIARIKHEYSGDHELQGYVCVVIKSSV